MGLKRLLTKNFLGGGSLITGHIVDALLKKQETGKNFRACLEESVHETFTEDMPGTSHIYKKGHTDGKKEGTIEQAERDEIKMTEMHRQHEQDRKEWTEINKQKDDLIDELEKNFK